VGELQSIQRDTFVFALQQTRTADPRLADAAMEVEIVPATFRCRACEREFTLADTAERDAEAKEAIHFVPELAHAFMRCPSCASPDFDVARGRGVSIAAIEGEAPDA
jgi:hydrogenase nickel incorporation protein HypA/HybF